MENRIVSLVAFFASYSQGAVSLTESFSHTVKAQSALLHEFFTFFTAQFLERITLMQPVLFVTIFTDL